MARNRIQIKRVHRLTVFFHHIVRNIHQIVNRADAAGRQPSLHPFRRRTDFDIGADPRAVSRAEFGIFYLYADIILRFFRRRLHFHFGRDERLPECRRRFSRNAKNAVTVYPVGSNFILEYGITQSERFYRIRACLRVFRENIDTFFRRFRVHLSGRAEFLNGAHHTVRRYAAQFSCLDGNSVCRQRPAVMTARYFTAVKHNRYFISFFYILRPGYNLNHFRADVDLTDNQFIGIRMFFNLFNLADDNLLQIFI